MTPTLVRQNLPHAGTAPPTEPGTRARDWSEIQERMLVPLYEAAYDRLDVGPATRMVALGCGAGLALLMAASRGADVTGVEPRNPGRLALARERLQPDSWSPRARTRTRLADALPETDLPYTLVTAFETTDLLGDAVRRAERGAPVVLAGWGPPERCATAGVLRVADPLYGGWRPAHRDDLEETARQAGLKPDGSGRVACPFGYADTDSAVRGLLSTELFDAAVEAGDAHQVDKEIREALHPYTRRDGTVWMPNVFRYLIARVP
ncbi:class I SAM-dependent methyltransferase [Streptomyces roseirectus]|uniref:Class I SAM-dependent methyltransferase n=1 Tax=Streptomyces roseirectus TaxID=2768066 RepID=A0A7H0IAX0_9ACTN|nr:class I SAM-dependent methyltransferase [Streptomyces roseirectus]QNP69936.1 class I SAM-dependent methyltransferase [Streptomyces roseirectus]